MRDSRGTVESAPSCVLYMYDVGLTDDVKGYSGEKDGC